MSQHDPIDDLPPDLRAMLDAAREPDALPPEVEGRMLRALDARAVAEAAAPSSGGAGGARGSVRRGPLHRAPWQTLAGFVLGALLGAAIYHLARPAPAPRVIERVVTRDREVRVEVPVPTPAPRPAEAPRVNAPEPSPQRPVARDEEPDDLGAEQALLDRARVSLARGDAAGALDSLASHARRFRRGQLAAERDAMRVRALVTAGRRAEAEALAERFRRRYPRHALLRAVEGALR